MSQPQRTAGPTPARRRAWQHRLLALSLVLAGGALSGWPVAETYAHNEQGAHEVTAYVDAVAAAAASDPQPLQADLTRARAYNKALSPAALWDPWGDETPAASPAHDGYLTQLAAFEAMGRVRIPQINVDLPILHDATKGPLSRGVGHLYGTSLPVGGPDTHAVLAAHTGSSRRTFFDRLPELQRGHTFFLDVAGTTLTYRVDRISVVEPWELDAVERLPGADHVTLVTCYQPPGEHNQRLLVRGVRVPDAAAAGPGATGQSTNSDAAAAVAAAAVAAPVAVDLSVQQWMVPRLATTGGAAALAVLMGASWVVGDRRRAASERADRGAPAGATEPDHRARRAAASDLNVTDERTPVEAR